MVAMPHEPPEARFTREQFALYRTGYEWALVMALRTMNAAEERFKMRERTRRLDARRAKL